MLYKKILKQLLQFASCLLLLFAIYTPVSAQINTPYFGPQKLINGFTKDIQGESIPYFSIYPDYAKVALLTRCTDGHKIIEWETAAMPVDIKNKYAYFSWIGAHSTGTSKGSRNFDLFINEKYILTFTTFPNTYPPYWTFGGKDSTRIVFEYKKQDGAKDAHGIVYLRVPVAEYKKGEPLRIKIVGQNQNSPDWFMTFKYTFEEKIDIAALPFLLNNNSPKKIPLQLTVLHFGSAAAMAVKINGKSEGKYAIKNGINDIQIPVDTATAGSAINIQANIGNQYAVNKMVTIQPVIKREIYFIPHSHTDIGYSYIQEDVEKIHNKNIRDALVMIDKTKGYPAGSKFVWNVESLWSVENFLNSSTPSEKEKFFDAVRHEQIGLSGFYANILTGLSTPEEMDWITAYAVELRKQFKLPIESVMYSDIPGMSWSMVASMSKHGIRYFSNGPNYVEALPDKGDRIGSTLKALGDKPFWWKSTSGKDSILLWTAAKGYSSWHGFAPGAVFERGEKKIATYLNELNEEKYPYDMVQWRYNIVSDNGPIDTSISRFVKNWNEKYVSPKIILSTVNNLFEKFDKKYGTAIPVLSGDLTPYWEDGAYSTALEESNTRLLSEKLIQLEKIAAQNNIVLNKEILYRAHRSIIMFQEHTWGSWNSISDPDNPFTLHQWLYKKRFEDSAQYYTDVLEAALKEKTISANQISLFNSLPWKRNAFIEIDQPSNEDNKSLIDINGNAVAYQKLSDHRIGIMANEIPANGKLQFSFTKDVPKLLPAADYKTDYSIDSTTGAIKSIIYDGKQWVNDHHYKGAGEAIYIKGLNPDSAFFSTLQKQEWVEQGPLVKKLRLTATMEGCNEVQYEITQIAGNDNMYISVMIDKKAIREKESLHIAFPFSIEEPTVRVGMDDSFITPEHGQLYGSNKDFFSVQRWIDVSKDSMGVTISCPQGALFEIGNMVNEVQENGVKVWKKNASSSATLFLYAMNNYWHTNYKADQNGKVKFDFVLHFHEGFNLQEAQRTGMEFTQPVWVN
jgi:alpha-mannosidase